MGNNREIEAARAIARASGNKDWQFLGLHWDKVQGEDDAKHELLKMGKAALATSAQLEPKRVLDNSIFQVGTWVQHPGELWWGQIVTVTGADSKHQKFGIHWYKVSDTSSEDISSVSIRDVTLNHRYIGDKRPW